MRNGLIRLLSAMVLASTMATGSCGDYSDDTQGTAGTGPSGGVGGAPAGVGGSAGGGGTAGTGPSAGAGGAPAGAGGSAGSGGTPAGAGGSSGNGGTPAGAGGGEANPVTTLGSTAALSELTEAEATRLCDDTYTYYGSAIGTETFCKWKGLNYATSSSAPTEEQMRANCTSKETTCLDDPVAALSSNSGCNSIPSNCTATVADYAGCVMDQAATFTETVDGISSCEELTSEGTDAVWEALGAAPLASCTFSDTCPGLYPPNPMY